MVDVHNLSDADLRTKLIEFGFPVMPITGTTRNVMVKKLKLLLENQSKPSDRRSLGKFSSDEESDSDMKVSKRDKNRRATMAVPPTQQAKGEARGAAEEPSAMVAPVQPPPAVKEKRKSATRAAKMIVIAQQESPDNDSDSEPEIIETDYKKNVKPVRAEVPLQPKETVPKKSVEEVAAAKSTSGFTSRYSMYSKPSFSSPDDLDKIRKRLSLNTQAGVRNNDGLNLTDAETPFLSNFTRKLSQMSHKPDAISPPTGRADGSIKEYDTNGSIIYQRNSYLRSKPSEYSRTSYSFRGEPQAAAKSSSVSVLLIAAVIFFFVVLAALYYGLHSGNTTGGELAGKSGKYQLQD